jgi:methyl halide transferase
MFYLLQDYFNFFKAFNNSSTKLMTINKHYWNNRYKSKQTGWDMGRISEPLKTYFDQLSDKNISILIPGCGNAHEAKYLIMLGFTNITLIDFADEVVLSLKQKFKQAIDDRKMKILGADFFDMNNQFDLIIEQTFFCALDPSLRKNYAAKMHSLLKTDGKLVGVLFSFPLSNEGPPFGGSM